MVKTDVKVNQPVNHTISTKNIGEVTASSIPTGRNKNWITPLVIYDDYARKTLGALEKPFNSEELSIKLMETIETFGKPFIIRFQNCWGTAILIELKYFCNANAIKLAVQDNMGRGRLFQEEYGRIKKLLD